MGVSVKTVSTFEPGVPVALFNAGEGGQFAADPVASFVEHIHDEVIHHTAEIALLRDLYRCRLNGNG